MKSSELDYALPGELMAQHRAERRDPSRLLVYERSNGAVRHGVFADLAGEIGAGALTVVNDTRVVPAGIPIERPRGEVLLLEARGDGVWEALARPTRRLRAGAKHGPVELLEHLGGGRWLVRLDGEPAGETPLPPYITEPLDDPERYQTVYAREPGSAAAPTAGLHFTPELLAQLDIARVTLHVGLDTFRPVAVEQLDEHPLHGERYEVAAEAWDRIGQADRVVAVGTTTVRVLETRRRGPGRPGPHRARRGTHAGVHARRDEGDGQEPAPRRGARGGRAHPARQHLPPAPPSRPRSDRPSGGPARLHGLERADPDRLGR